MPIPKPTAGEKEKEFISRCSADDVMNREYPNRQQRVGICHSAWDKSKREK